MFTVLQEIIFSKRLEILTCVKCHLLLRSISFLKFLTSHFSQQFAVSCSFLWCANCVRSNLVKNINKFIESDKKNFVVSSLLRRN